MKINRLDDIFKERKVQNRILAKYFSKSEETISKWRNNKRQPSLENLLAIAQFLRVDICELLEPTNWADKKSETYDQFSARVKDEANK
ncbi:helix-turn-helix domain-containing protein [Chryseobacterium sp.]|uniref:helix-turn-helix domain-containing protein n=1 Tax=Chryseobacterium sp. TaxID=1871047 RepID=UPI0012A8AE3C|nr:helix-turn-helix transcriptional regulator [Chryseobacterium sp.]QFG53454.1 helix-turn-helix transcriptional regulator [Chryseobacterium sp.]